MKTRMIICLMMATGALTSTAMVAQAAEPDPLAQPPHWPLGLQYPPEMIEIWSDGQPERRRRPDAADLLVWTPPDATRIRAVMMFANNTDLVKIGEHRALRQVAAKHEIGIIYLQSFSERIIERADPPAAAEAGFAAILDLVAKRTGIAEFRHAPWITFGKSSRGRFAFRPAWQFPDRVIASVAYHGEVPTWPMPQWSKAATAHNVMHLNVQGLTEWDGTWYRHVRPGLLNYHRHTGWLAHQLVIYGVDHGYYPDYYLYPNFGKPMDKNHRLIRCTDVWDYIARFLDKAMQLRVPNDVYPTDAPTQLIALNRDSGYLIHPRAPEELLGAKWFAFRQADNGDYRVIPWPDEPTPVFDPEQGRIPLAELIRPAGEIPAEQRAAYLWVPDRDLARAWLRLHNIYNQKIPALE
jgi:hypothetical protein